MVQSAFHQTLGNNFTFQQDNNVKDKAKSTLELLTKKTVNVPEWPSYSFDLNLFKNLLSLLGIVYRWVIIVIFKSILNSGCNTTKCGISLVV